MKNLFTLLLLSVCLNAFGQSDAQLAAIDTKVTAIHDAKDTYEMQERFRSGDFGYQHAYLEEGQLRLVIAYMKEADADKHVEWYFENGKLIFSQQTWTDRTTQAVTDHQEFYMVDGELTRWTDDGIAVDPSSQMFSNMNSELKAYARRMLAQ